MKKAFLNKDQLSGEKWLEQVREQFSHWRRTRLKKGRIPQELWESALDLYPVFSKHRICKSLCLNQNALKSRLEKRNIQNLPTQSCQPSPSPSPFIEISLPTSSPELNIKLEYLKGDGSCLKLELNGPIPMNDLESLCQKLKEA